MKELGRYSQREHKDLIQFLLNYNWKDIYLVGEEFCDVNESEHIRCYQNVDILKSKMDIESYSDTHFLLKGSRSMKLESLLD